MKAFLWVMLCIFLLSCMAKLMWLATGELPVRKPRDEAIDVVINFAVVVWASILLYEVPA